MNQRKLLLYLGLSFGFSWAILALGTWIGPDNQIGGLLTGVLYMWGPALAVMTLTSFGRKESLKPYGWQFERLRWPWILTNAFLPIGILILTLFMVYLLGNVSQIEGFGTLDLSRDGMHHRMEEIAIEAGQNPDEMNAFTELEIPVPVLLIVLAFGGLVGGVTVNLIASFGEEIGWRGFMLRETRSLGYWKSAILIGVVWGLWHAPLIYLGHNYPGHPWEGIAMMVFFCIAMSLVMNLLAMKSSTIAGPSAFHGVTNGIAGSSLVLVHDANPLIGGVAGVAGILALLMVAGVLIATQGKYLKDWHLHSYDPEEEEKENASRMAETP